MTMRLGVKGGRKTTVFVLAAVSITILAAGLLVPLSTPRITTNQMRAAHSIRQLIAAERQYASEFPAIGFTCDLHKLRDAGLIDGVLASGEKAAYRYKIEGCISQGRVSKFSLIAQPTIAGVTGKFTFCASEEVVLWYRENSVQEDCLRGRVRWKNPDR